MGLGTSLVLYLALTLLPAARRRRRKGVGGARVAGVGGETGSGGQPEFDPGCPPPSAPTAARAAWMAPLLISSVPGAFFVSKLLPL